MISDYLVDKMLDYHVIAEDDRIIYLYGIKEGLTILQNIIISIVLGILFNNLFQTFIFLIAYIPLRSFAGGYHAASVKKCMVYSLILILLQHQTKLKLTSMHGIVLLLFQKEHISIRLHT